MAPPAQHGGSVERSRRVRAVVDDYARRRASGEDVRYEDLLAANADLLPELAEELRRSAGFAGTDSELLGGAAIPRPARGDPAAEPPASPARQMPPAASARPESTATSTRDDVSFVSADEPAAVALALSFPGYQLVRELSRGGQGVVYEAVQDVTRRRVAIKVLLAGPYASMAAKRRFEREIELVAQLRHPNIISIFHSGVTTDGRQFYVMDYVSGQPLHRYVRAKHLPLDEMLALFATVCAAVQYAHQRGIMHRDLKPSNILVEPDGTPKLLDFGLAKWVAQPVDPQMSATQQPVGTLPYMSPEQATGHADEVDTRTDIYSLGVILYELLTGGLPYSVDGKPVDVLRRIAEWAPVPPQRRWTAESGVAPRSGTRVRAARCPIDDALATVALKALAKERERRYQSAGELGRDVQRCLAGEPIEAKRDSAWYLLRTVIARHRRRLVVGVVMGLVLVGGAAAVTRSVQLAVRERERAAIADQSRRIAQAQTALKDGSYEEALRLVRGLEGGDRHAVEAGLIRGQALLRLGRTDEARQDLLQLTVARPGEAALWALLAQAALRGDPERAAEYTQRVRQLCKDTAEDYYLRGLAEPDDAKAIDLLGESLSRAPDFFEARLSRALAYFRKGEFDKAQIDAEVASSLRPQDGMACFNLGTIQTRRGQYAEAIPALRRAVARLPELASGWYNLGTALDGNQQYHEAVTAHERSVALQPDSAQKWFALGRARFHGGDRPGAQQAFEHALELDPTHFNAMFGLGIVHTEAGRYDQAITTLRRSLELREADGLRVWTALGRAHELAGHEAATLAAFEEALRCAPRDVVTLNNLAWLLLTVSDPSLRDPARALALAERANELASPEEGEVYVEVVGTLALAELRTGCAADAYEYAQRVLELSPQEPWGLALAAGAALALGRAEEAQGRFNRAEAVAQQEKADAALQNFLDELRSELQRKKEGVAP